MAEFLGACVVRVPCLKKDEVELERSQEGVKGWPELWSWFCAGNGKAWVE